MAPDLGRRTIGIATPTDRRTPEGATLSPQSIVGWVIAVTSDLLPSQSATLAALVAAAVRLERVNLAAVGRAMAGDVAAKHTIERAWRFTCNRRVEVAATMAGAIKKIAARRRKRLVVSLDRTDVRSFHTLMAAACIGGRAVPLLWASYTGSRLRRSQNALEERLLRRLAGLIPGPYKVVILADRGFGRAEWAAVCRELRFHYIVRIRPDVTIARPRYRGVLRRYPTRKGMAHVLRGVDYRKDRRVRHSIVVRWRHDLPKERDGPWYPMTDLDGRAEAVCRLYGRRMSVEELFRDGKGRGNGQSRRDPRFRSPDRFDRFVLAVSLAYIRLVGLGLGLKAKLKHDPAAWCTNRRDAECSAFTVGRAMLDRTDYPPEELLRMVSAATIQVGKQWG